MENDNKKNDTTLLHKIYSVDEIRRMAGISRKEMKKAIEDKYNIARRRLPSDSYKSFAREDVHIVLKELGVDAELIIEKEISEEQQWLGESVKNEPQDAPILLNKFYTVREIANIAGLTLQKIHNLITWRPQIKGKKRIMDGHAFFDRETTLEILMELEAQADKKALKDMKAKGIDLPEELEKAKDLKEVKETEKARTKRKADPVFGPKPGPNEAEAIRARKNKVDDFNVSPSTTDHAAPKPEEPKKDYVFEEQRRGRTVQPCPAHTGKYCPKAISCPWWIEKVRGSDQGACSVKVIAASLDEIAYGEEKE